MSMFGVIVSGRLAQVDFQNVDVNKFLTTIPDADSVNHIVVFMTGTAALPIGMGGSVYFSWPDPNSPPQWQYLGAISNEKPSAIFRITKLKQSAGDVVPTGFGFSQSIVSKVAQIGISIEPLSQISQMTPAVSSTFNDNFAAFTTRTAEHLFNFVSSFAKTLPGTTEQVVPLLAIQQWYQNYSRKLELNPGFWKS